MIGEMMALTDWHRLQRVTRHAGIVIVFLWMASATVARARTYKVSAMRHKIIQGSQDAEGPQYSLRQESSDAQWALEVRIPGGKTEGQVDARLLDSTGTVMWEGETGDILLLSFSAPSFAVASNFGPDRQVYNLNAGRDPVFTAQENSAARLFQSRDGEAFGLTRETGIDVVSVGGERLGFVPLAKGMLLGPAALANKGQYIALEVWNNGPRKRTRPAEYQISLMDPHGALIGRIDTQSDPYLPRCLALSSDIPPRIAVATDRGVSMWTPEGKAMWSDSTAFPPADGHWLVKVVYVTDQGHVLAVTTTTDAHATFWAWDTAGTREAQLDLPDGFNALATGADFMAATDSSIAIQSQSEFLTLGWHDE